MPSHSSPTVKRRRLATELRHYREQAGFTIEEVAARLEWSSAKISRIENARVSVLPRDVKFLVGIYGVDEDDPAREVLLTLARESRQKGWWQQLGDGIPDWFEVYVGLEADAASVSAYYAEFIPGLLQTEAYARAVHRASLITADNEEIEQRVKIRLARQALMESEDGPKLWFILNEAVIRRVVGGAAAMHDQIMRLIDVSYLPNVIIQVVPFEGGAHPGMDGSFSLLTFPNPNDPHVVYFEYHTGALYMEKPEQVQRYTLMFDHLRAAALPMEASRALMARVAESLVAQHIPRRLRSEGS